MLLEPRNRLSSIGHPGSQCLILTAKTHVQSIFPQGPLVVGTGSLRESCGRIVVGQTCVRSENLVSLVQRAVEPEMLVSEVLAWNG